MESDNNNKNYGEGQQQLPRSARKRKLDELADDSLDQPAAEEKQKQHQTPENFESHSREDLIKLVRKQLFEKNEAQRQLETTKKEAEESAKQAEESAKQTAEEFSQRIVQLDQEKAEVHESLRQKLAEIVEMHKEVEEKSEEVAEKAKQIDALLIQLNDKESTRQQHQIGLPTQQQMKIQLSLETWYDMLSLVPRHQLGNIVPKIGDRKFAAIVQPFLHEYKEIRIVEIEIVAPYKEDPDDPHPRVRVWQRQNHRHLRIKMAEAQMPTNIKTLGVFQISNEQNYLLDNVQLLFDNLAKDIVQPILCHILPLINGIVSIGVVDGAQLANFYDDANSKEIYELNMKMMEKPSFLESCDPKSLTTKKIDLYCRWLYQTARADGKPRVLLFENRIVDTASISRFIDRIKKDFLLATDPVTFFIRITFSKEFLPRLEAICLDNDKSKEKLVTYTEKSNLVDPDAYNLLISRYPLASAKKWIAENENDILDWEYADNDETTIELREELEVVKM